MTLEDIRTEYYARKRSIDSLYDFIKKNQEEKVDICCIMKASFILMLYNLIEDTVKSLLSYILETSAPEIKYQSLINESKQVIIISRKSEILEKQEPLKFFKKLDDIIQKCIKDEIHNIKVKDVMQNSGNIDSKDIKKIYYKFGYELKKESLYINLIKDKRCQLAHGEISFQNCGTGLSISDLFNYKKDVYLYIGRLFTHTANLLKKKTYLKKD